MGQPARPSFRNEFAGVGINRKADSEVLVRVWIVTGSHGKQGHCLELAAIEPGPSPEVFEELFGLEAVCLKLPHCLGKKRLKEKVETHVSRVTGDGTPLLSVSESLDQCSIAAAGKAQNTPHLRRGLNRELGDQPGKQLSNQEVLPVSHRLRIDILISSQRSEAIGEGHDHRAHLPGLSETFHSLGEILAKCPPGGHLQTAVGETGQIDQEREAGWRARSRGRNIDLNTASGRISQPIPLQGPRIDPGLDNLALERRETMDWHLLALLTVNMRRVTEENLGCFHDCFRQGWVRMDCAH